MTQIRAGALAALALGWVLALAWGRLSSLGLPSAPADTSGPPTLTRPHDPVVVPGARLDQLAGVQRETIFVYAHQGGVWVQMPSQIDERDASGAYVPLEDGRLDGNDELVFMAQDGGGRAADPTLNAGGAIISAMYLITVTDPISHTHAWAYVFHSAALTRTTADYVSYDGGHDRIFSPGVYAFGFHPTYASADYLTLGNSSVDLLDRMKLRGTAKIAFFTFSFNEENSVKNAVRAIDGPVRVTRVSTVTLQLGGYYQEQTLSTLFAYRSLIVQPGAINIPSSPQITYLRASTDWNVNATGMVYYDANTPAGVTVDGSPDAVTAQPATTWGQVTGVTGTVIVVSGLPTGMGGVQSTYYKDSSVHDSSDTGDQRSFGDAGFQVHNPASGQYTLLGHTYVLTGPHPNVGAMYLAGYEHPVEVDVGIIVTPEPQHLLYLPLVLRAG